MNTTTTVASAHPSMSTKFIEIHGLEQTFRTAKGLFPALRDIHLTIAKGEFVALIGHSGCGKSTLLNLIAGLTTPTNGALPVSYTHLTLPTICSV